MALATTIDTRLQSTVDGAILFDGGALAQVGGADFDPAWFEPRHWHARGAVATLGAGRGTIMRVPLPGGDWTLRHYRRGGLVARVLGDRYLWNGAERTRGFVEWRLLAALTQRGLNVPVPVAARYRRSGAQYRADLITRWIDGTQTLAERVRADTADAADAARVGACVAEFHAAGAYHADLNAHNILLDAQRVWLLDFDRGALRAPARSWQFATLARLRRSLLKLGAARDGEAHFDRTFWGPLMAAYERALGTFAAQAASGSVRG
jgi:3-deoxy-D-manno-octulosonic acid kinase